MKKKTLPVDVAIITYNRYDMVFRCISHILTSNYLPKNIIIIHSKPAKECQTKEKIVQLCEMAKVNLKYIHVQQKGISYSRNQAVKHVESPFYAFLDDDEYPTENWLNIGYQVLKNNPEIVAVSGPKDTVNKSSYWSKVWAEIYKSSFSYVGEADFVTSGNTFFRKSFIDKNKIKYDDAFTNSSEDKVFSLRIQQKKGKMYFHKDLIEFHNFRDTPIELYKQWYGYGISMKRYAKLHLNKKNLGTLGFLIESVQGVKLLNWNNIHMLPALLFIDIAYILGFAKEHFSPVK